MILTRLNQAINEFKALAACAGQTLRRHEPAEVICPEDIKAGDVIGFSGNTWISALINLGTYGVPFGTSAMSASWPMPQTAGCCCSSPRRWRTCPVRFPGRASMAPRRTRWSKILKAYEGKVWHYPVYRKLYDHEEKRLTDFLMATIHTPYDAMGAFRAAGIGLSWVESCFRKQDLHTIFCSEWVASAYADIGIMPTAYAGRWSPNHLCRALREKELVFRPRRLR